MWYAKQQNWPDDVRLITEWNIREFLAYIGEAGKRWGISGNGSESSRSVAKYSTVHHYYCVLKAFFNWCVGEGFIKESPLVKIRLKNPRLNVVQPFSNQEILKMLEVCDHDIKNNSQLIGYRNKAIILMLLDTGLRVSELKNIKVDEVDTDRGWIKVKGKGAKEREIQTRQEQRLCAALSFLQAWRYAVNRPNGW